jgi:hypothetical protein
VRVIRSLGLDGATVSLPAGIDLERRAERMNAFWERSFASSIKTWSSSQCARMAGASGANCLSAVSGYVRSTLRADERSVQAHVH